MSELGGWLNDVLDGVGSHSDGDEHHGEEQGAEGEDAHNTEPEEYPNTAWHGWLLMATLQNIGQIYMGNPVDEGPPAAPIAFLQNNFAPAAAGHTAYKSFIQYSGMTGLEVPPIAAGLVAQSSNPYMPLLPTQTQSYRSFSPTCMKTVWWAARRKDGNLPACPHPQPTANEILYRWWINQVAPDLDQSGGNERTIEVQGVYIYKLLLPVVPGDPSTTDGLYFPCLISDTGGFGQFLLQSVNFVSGVLGYGTNFQNEGPPVPTGFAPPSTLVTGVEGVFQSPGTLGLTPPPSTLRTVPTPQFEDPTSE